MTLLNPIWLLLFPFVLLPVVIHLWNQSRHKVVDWGAMHFLIAAQQIRGGRQRLRHWLIMFARMLAVAGLMLLLARPLSSGLMGSLIGGQAQTVLVVLDRSASMQQQTSLGGLSKLQSGLQTIVSTLGAAGHHSKLYLVDAASSELRSGDTVLSQVVEVQKPADLLDIAASSATDAQTNMPSMLESLLHFVKNNQTGRTDVWICSDGSDNDWQASSSQWPALEKQFAQLKGIRLQYLHLPEPCPDNLSVRVQRCELRGSAESPELAIDLSVQSSVRESRTQDIPLTIMIGSARHTLSIPLQGGQAELIDHRIPLAEKTQKGWGYVELPGDCQPADNRYYFTFAPVSAMQTLIVAEQPAVVRPIELTAKVPMQENSQANVTMVGADQVAGLDLSSFHLMVWQGVLPTGTLAQKMEAYVQSRGTLILLPPAAPNDAQFMGLSWGQWQAWDEGQRVVNWESERDLLRRSSDGTSLPLDQLAIYQSCRLNGAHQVLAVLGDGQPLITKNNAAGGGVVALTTWPLGTHSTLDKNVIGLYVMVQRSLEQAFQRSSGKHSIAAGEEGSQAAATMQVLAANPRSADEPPLPSSTRPQISGVYQNDQTLLAINRPLDEDQAVAQTAETLKQLFGQLDFHLIDGRGNETNSLANEIWKSLAVVMALALLVEAILTLPPKRSLKSISLANKAKVAA